MKRDLYIDFAKGLATLSIVFIHTAFWSGQLYLPSEVRTLSLLIDVPVFFALSGLTSGNNVEKTLYRLLKLQVTYMIFVSFLFFLDGIMKWGIFGIFGTEGMQSYYTVFGTKYAVPSVDSAFNWDILGNIGFQFFNKTDKNIYLNLEESFFILNGISYNYYRNRVFTNSTSSGATTSRGTSATIS